MEFYNVHKYFGNDENVNMFLCSKNENEINFVNVTDLAHIFYVYEIGLKTIEEAKNSANFYLSKKPVLIECEQMYYNKYMNE